MTSSLSLNMRRTLSSSVVAKQELFSAREAATAQQDALMKQVMDLAEQLQGEAHLRASLDAQLADTSAQQARLQEQLHSQEAASAVQAEEAGAQLHSEITALQAQLQDQEAALKEAVDQLAASESARKGAQVQMAEQERHSTRLELCILQLQEQLTAQEATSAEQHAEQVAQLQSRMRELQGLLQEQGAELARLCQERAANDQTHSAALEQAGAEAEGLRTQLAGAVNGKAAGMAECIKNHASHSEMLEQLQQEHEQEINR